MTASIYAPSRRNTMPLARRSPETWHASAVRVDDMVSSCGISSYWMFSAVRYLLSVGAMDMTGPPVRYANHHREVFLKTLAHDGRLPGYKTKHRSSTRQL